MQDVHAGFINFANAAALGLFGRDLLSLRYPLALMGVLQSVIAGWLFLPWGRVGALSAAVLTTTLAGILFLNPTAHWYSLFVTILLTAVLERRPPGSRWRLETVGVLLGTLVLFRQLTGVLVAMSLFTWLLLEPLEGDDDPPPDFHRVLLARAILCLAAFGLCGYLAGRTGLLTLLLFGIWPVAILAQAVVRTRYGNRQTLDIVRRLTIGGAISAAPLLLYHLLHGSLREWINDALLSAVGMTGLDFFRTGYFGDLLQLAAVQFSDPHFPLRVLRAVWWGALMVTPAVVGGMVLRRLPDVRHATRRLPVWCVIAPFYAVVSLHYQIPIYLFYSAAFSSAALMGLLIREWPTRDTRIGIAAFTFLMAFVSLSSYAARPLRETWESLVHGDQSPALIESGLARCSLQITEEEQETYRQLLVFINDDSRPGDAILALPSHAEFYFLGERRNPLWFFNSALGLRTHDDLDRALERLAADPPRLIFFKPEDKYTTPLTRELLTRVWWHYQHVTTIDGIEVYRAWLDAPRLSR